MPHVNMSTSPYRQPLWHFLGTLGQSSWSQSEHHPRAQARNTGVGLTILLDPTTSVGVIWSFLPATTASSSSRSVIPGINRRESNEIGYFSWRTLVILLSSWDVTFALCLFGKELDGCVCLASLETTFFWNLWLFGGTLNICSTGPARLVAQGSTQSSNLDLTQPAFLVPPHLSRHW